MVAIAKNSNISPEDKERFLKALEEMHKRPFTIVDEFPESSEYLHKGYGWLLLLVFLVVISVVFGVAIGIYLMIKCFM